MLALVIEQPCSGSDLLARYRTRFQLLAPRSRGNFSVIRRLEDLAFIEVVPPVTPPRPESLDDASTCFTATAAGISAHRRWLLAPIDEQHWRIEILARIATGASLGPEGLRRLIELYHHHATTNADRAERRFAANAGPQSLAELAVELACQEQQDTLIIQRDWAERALRIFDEHAKRAPRRPHGSPPRDPR